MSAQKGYILPLVLFGTVTLLSGIGLLFYFFLYRPQQVVLTPLPTPNITSLGDAITDFESCAKAGNPVMESYPRRCNANGRSFTEVLEKMNSDSTSSSSINNWNVYTNSDFGYSLNYPKDWNSQSESLSNSSPIFKSGDAKYDDVSPYISQGSIVFIVVKETSKTFENIEQERLLYSPSPQTDAPRIIDIRKVRLFGVDVLREISTVGVNSLTYLLVYNQREYSLNCNYLPEDTNSFAKCEQILATFKLF